MASSTFISWICHFWARFWLNFNFGDFRAYFGYFSLVKIDFFEIYFQSWRIKLRVLKFFRPILIIKRHQKNTQAKLFEKFASRQHALMMRLFNLLLSPIGRVASWPMRNIETFPSKQMYLYLSLVERKVAEFYHNTWLKWLVFIASSGQWMVSLAQKWHSQ